MRRPGARERLTYPIVVLTSIDHPRHQEKEPFRAQQHTSEKFGIESLGERPTPLVMSRSMDHMCVNSWGKLQAARVPTFITNDTFELKRQEGKALHSKFVARANTPSVHHHRDTHV